MKRTILALGLLAACAVSAQASDTRSLRVDGHARSYIVHRPVQLDSTRPAPLVVVLHGGFGSARQAEKSYKWNKEADRQGFVVVYPDGIRRAWNAGGICCGRPNRNKIDDVKFLTKLLETVVQDENIDRTHVYLTGISNGAAMAYRYACEGSFPVAAIGGVAGSFSYACAKVRPVSVMAIHGLDDRNIPLDGGKGSKGVSGVTWLGVTKTLELFRQADRCEAPVVRENGAVRKAVSRCAQGREVTLITIAGARHQWPGSKGPSGLLARLLLDPPSKALDATPVLWVFFSTHAAD